MFNAILDLSILLLAGSQEASPPPWRTDAAAARESALKESRPCVILLLVDSL
jgi:hypothetical protein